MNALRSFACCAATAFLLSACSSAQTNDIAEPQQANAAAAVTQDATLAEATNSAPASTADASTGTEEESDAAAILGNRDDVAVRLVEVLPIEAEGSSRFTAEVLGILGSYGDGGVVRPELSVVADPSVTFTTVPEGCTVVSTGVDCVVDVDLTRTSDFMVDTATLPLEFEYSVADGSQLTVVFDLTASSFENRVSNDPVPENNILTIEAS